MSYIQQILSDDRIRQLCVSALSDAEALTPALDAIYRQGFAGTPQLENISHAFVQRLLDVLGVKAEGWTLEKRPGTPSADAAFKSSLNSSASE